MLLLLAIALLAEFSACGAIVCSRLKPDGSIPKCSECTDCSIPADATDYALYITDNVLSGGARRWNNPVNPDDPILMTATPHAGGGLTLRLEVSGSAADVYRAFGISNRAKNDSKQFWLTGNNKGKGAICEVVLDWAVKDLNQVQDAKSWSQVPADKCF